VARGWRAEIVADLSAPARCTLCAVEQQASTRVSALDVQQVVPVGRANIARNMTLVPRIIVDTNVLVAATRNREGPSFALMQLVRTGRIRMCCSPALFLEYEDVLRRPEQRAASGLRVKDVDAILNELAALLEPVLTHYQWRPQLRDPADEMVLEAAANARVDGLVTYNLRDFLPARRFGCVRVHARRDIESIQPGQSKELTP
jgi:putative PIN family toxin of toxin-antitoxin system